MHTLSRVNARSFQCFFKHVRGGFGCPMLVGIQVMTKVVVVTRQCQVGVAIGDGDQRIGLLQLSQSFIGTGVQNETAATLLKEGLKGTFSQLTGLSLSWPACIKTRRRVSYLSSDTFPCS